MSDNHDDTQRNFRRIRRKDRKRDISASGNLFPDDALSDDNLPDFDALLLPDSDDTDLSALQGLSSDTVRMPVVTPREERFPPLPSEDTREMQTRPVQHTRPNVPQRTAPPPDPARLAAQDARRRRNRGYNRLTIFMLLATFGVIAYYAGVWLEPFWTLNPFPPEANFAFVTATPEQPSQVLVITSTPLPDVAIVESTPLIIPSPPAIDETQAALSAFPFIVTDPAVTYIPNGNQQGCEWGAIAGTVRAQDSSPIDGFRVQVTGDGIQDTVFSGSTRTFGEGGFELPLGNVPIAGAYTVQLFTPQGAPVSDVYTVITSDRCEQNIAIINFIQIRSL
ncbi:MAG: hypothetical protein ACPG7F_01060 [Aggregatilineales bacterium]